MWSKKNSMVIASLETLGESSVETEISNVMFDAIDPSEVTLHSKDIRYLSLKGQSKGNSTFTSYELTV